MRPQVAETLASSREVFLAWSITLDADARRRGLAAAIFDGFVVDPDDEVSVLPRRYSPAELLASTAEGGGFGFDGYADGVWTFSCLLHDDDWANTNHERLVANLAALAPDVSGILVAAGMWRLSDAWLIRRGRARKVTPLPAVAFAPTPDEAGVKEAIRLAREACVAVRSPQRPDLAHALPQLVAEYLGGLGLEATADPLSYRFTEYPLIDLWFVVEKRKCVPTLRYRRGDRVAMHAFEAYPIDALKDCVKSLRDSYNNLSAELPFFLLEQGVTVPPDRFIAVATRFREKIRRVPKTRPATPEIIMACADFLLDGVYDDLARETLIELVKHPNSPVNLAQRLASHSSRSIQQACAARLQRS